MVKLDICTCCRCQYLQVIHRLTTVQGQPEYLPRGQLHLCSSSWNTPVRKQDLLTTSTSLASRFVSLMHSCLKDFMTYHRLDICTLVLCCTWFYQKSEIKVCTWLHGHWLVLRPLSTSYSNLSPFWRPFSRLTWVSRCLSKQRLMEVVVTTGAISCAKLQSNRHHQQTNIQFFYRPDALPVPQPTVSKHRREKYHIPWTCLPQAHMGVFQLCLWSLTSWLPWGRGAIPLISPLMPVPLHLTPMIVSKLFDHLFDIAVCMLLCVPRLPAGNAPSVALKFVTL